MSVTSVSAANNAYLQAVQSEQTNPFSQRRQDFSALTQALSSGDLAGAQKAFAAFQQDSANTRQVQTLNPTAQSSQTSQTSLNDAINALGKALSSGDLSGAQQAFATLQQDMQNMRQSEVSHGHHHHHHGGGTQTAPAATAVTGASANPSGSGINTTA